MNSLRFLCFLLLPILLAGCAGFDNALFEQRVTEVPGPVIATNVVTRTNLVTLPATTNILSGEVTPARMQAIVTPEIEFIYAPPTFTTNFVVRPIVQDGLRATGALPIPYAGTATFLLTSLVGFYAAWKNKRTAVGAVTSMQAARDWLQTTPEGQAIDAKLKAILIEKQLESGVIGEVRHLLDRYIPKH